MQGVTLLAGLTLLGSLAVPAGLLASEQAPGPTAPEAAPAAPNDAAPVAPDDAAAAAPDDAAAAAPDDAAPDAAQPAYEREPKAAPEPGARAAATRTVLMEDIKFKPRKIRIDEGDTVRWENRDKVRHDAIGKNASFDTPLIGQGETSSHTFNRDGKFPYFCSIHQGMVGTIQVGSSSGGGGGSGGGSGGSGGTSSGSGGIAAGGDSTGASSGTGTGTSGLGSSGSSGTGSSLPSTGSELLWLGLIGYGMLAFGAFVRLAAIGR
jgi:plastocyanin